MGRVSPQYVEWVNEIMGKFEYKTKRIMFKEMKCCLVELISGSIVIRPTHHEKLEAWSDKGIEEDDCVVVPADGSPTELGAALRLALSRCT
ncbi:hypothetical protein D3C71_1788910 [compost metagenome]